MRVGIDASCWTNPRGYGRYTRGLVSALLAERGRHTFTLLADRPDDGDRWPLPGGCEVIPVAAQQAASAAASAGGRRSLRDIRAFSRAAGRAGFDVLFYPSVFTYFPAPAGPVTLVGVHDVIAERFPELVFPIWKQRLFWQLKGWLARRQADYLVTVSDHACEGIIDHFKWPRERIWVVGEAPDPHFRPLHDPAAVAEVLKPYGLTPADPYLICLGGLNPHKNLIMLFEVLADLRREPRFAALRLLLVGPAEEDTFTPGAAAARAAIQRLGLAGAVHLTGFVDDEVAVRLLNGARCLVMPSLDEGYGLGAVEAAACGIPVVATNSSPLPRLLAGGGLFFDPRRPEALQSALIEMLDDEDGRAAMGQIALARARVLTWARAAGQFRQLLDKIEGETR